MAVFFFSLVGLAAISKDHLGRIVFFLPFCNLPSEDFTVGQATGGLAGVGGTPHLQISLSSDGGLWFALLLCSVP